MPWTIRCGLILLLVLLPAGPFATTFPVTKTADTNGSCTHGNCSLREAIDAANTNPGPDVVTIPAGTYLLTLGQLSIAGDVEVAGAGQTNTVIDGNDSDRVLSVGNLGPVEISSVTIQNGQAGSSSGGGIANFGILTLSNSTVRSNQAYPEFYYDPEGAGGGISNSGTLFIHNSTVSGNLASGKGGGILNSGTLSLNTSTVSRNYATNDYFFGEGGGIFNNGNLTVNASTVSGNSAGYSFGGGIYNSGTTVILNSTLSANYARHGAGIANRAPDTYLFDTIVAANQGGNCDGSVVSEDYNLTDDTSCGLMGSADLVVGDALLGPLTDNGGPTLTHALLPGSPAIDAGDPTECPPAIPTDQRGVPRPQGAACDIGAFEYLPEPRGSVMLVAGAGALGLLYRRRR